MKANLIVLFVFTVFAVFFVMFKSSQPPEKIAEKQIPVTSIPTKTIPQSPKKYLFVPYWSFTDSLKTNQQFDSLIYFGITPNADGIQKDDLGYKKLETFVKLSTDQKEKLLGIRMTDSKTNFSILENKDAMHKVVNDSIHIAKENGFKGLVLDLELSSLPFQSVLTEVNEFSSEYYDKARKENLSFYITMYGDAFYRIRPFDIKTLANSSDGIFIMAYDFHKANGNPGPNFPFADKDTYGYDFQTMINDFLKVVPSSKLSVVFGLYGYDWQIDDKKNPTSAANSLSLNDINKKFFPVCKFKNCEINKNTSDEQNITYTDLENKNHVVWFEDESSVLKKTQFLKENNINSTALWAYSYF